MSSNVFNSSYYVDGELIRKNLTESQNGIPLFVGEIFLTRPSWNETNSIPADVQYIDVNTCEPVPAIYVDYW